mmetsp:Transcript_41266/g.123223  ORF Transcript_41266/g.123223 Transcript_41266/m.123223 type:complete len:439 (+) Transcript_41266:63-1379(+)
MSSTPSLPAEVEGLLHALAARGSLRAFPHPRCPRHVGVCHALAAQRRLKMSSKPLRSFSTCSGLRTGPPSSPSNASIATSELISMSGTPALTASVSTALSRRSAMTRASVSNSSGVTIVVTVPPSVEPMRPARPALCRYCVASAGQPMLYTCETDGRSRPRAAGGVHSSRLVLRSLNASSALMGSVAENGDDPASSWMALSAASGSAGLAGRTSGSMPSPPLLRPAAAASAAASAASVGASLGVGLPGGSSSPIACSFQSAERSGSTDMAASAGLLANTMVRFVGIPPSGHPPSGSAARAASRSLRSILTSVASRRCLSTTTNLCFRLLGTPGPPSPPVRMTTGSWIHPALADRDTCSILRVAPTRTTWARGLVWLAAALSTIMVASGSVSKHSSNSSTTSTRRSCSRSALEGCAAPPLPRTSTRLAGVATTMCAACR